MVRTLTTGVPTNVISDHLLSTEIEVSKNKRSLLAHDDWKCQRCGVFNSLTLRRCWNCQSTSTRQSQDSIILSEQKLRSNRSSSQIIPSSKRVAKDGMPLMKDILQQCEQTKDYQYGIELVQKKLQQPKKITRSVITHMIYLLSQGGQYEKALEVFNAIGKAKNMRLSRDIHHYHAILYGLSISNTEHKLAKAEELFNQMREAKIQPNRYVYTTLIKLHVVERKEDRAIQLYEDMVEEGIVPDIPLYNW